MGIYDRYETSSKLEQEGVRAEVGFNEDDGTAIAFVVTRAGGSNKEFLKALNRATRRFQRNGKIQIDDPEMQLSILRQVYAEAVVVGWENVRGRDGVDIPFSPQAALKLFSDLPELFNDIVGIAQDASYYRAALLEDVAKN